MVVVLLNTLEDNNVQYSSAYPKLVFIVYQLISLQIRKGYFTACMIQPGLEGGVASPDVSR